MTFASAPTFAVSRDRIRCLALSAFLGVVLAFGFLPTATDLGRWILSRLGLIRFADLTSTYLGFPALAVFFAMSMRAPSGSRSNPLRHWITISSILLPALCAFLFGLLSPAPGILDADSWIDLMPFLWIAICVPLGEECLFRGWLYAWLERMWPQKLFTASNPLPLSVWGSALAFSLWHLQNLASQSVWLTLFQCLYTFVLGLWLGAARNWTGRLAWPVFYHAILNISGALL